MSDILGNFSKLEGDKDKRKVDKNEEGEFSYSDIALDSVGRIENKEVFVSTFALKALLVLIFCGLIFKLFLLQIVQGEMNEKMAEGNRIRPRIIEAQRGLITDKDGMWLARNKPNFALALYPSDLPRNKQEREDVYKKVSELTAISVDEIRSEAEENGLLSLDMVLLKEDIPHDESLTLEKKIAGIQGVVIAKKSSREYAILPGLSHLIGYTSKVSQEDLKEKSDYYLSDRIGKTGLEYEYEKNLKGKHGVEQIEVDSKGNIVKVLVEEGNKEPTAGYDISLYLDRKLQEATGQALLKGLEEGKKLTGNEVNSGVAIVMDVQTGGLLSMVSLPDYNNNLFATRIPQQTYKNLVEDKSYPMFNRAIKGTYPPGSIVKIVMACAGLSEKVISSTTAFDTPAEIRIGDYVFPDWKDHGNTDIKRAIAESNNIFFYAIGGGFDKIKGIGIENIKKYWKEFGLGSPSGIDLPGEADGLLPDPEWKQATKKEPWYLGDTYHVSIGQGDLLVTPIQMVRAVAAVANGGKLLKPQLAKKMVDHDGNVIKEFGAQVERENFIDPNILKIVREGMRLTITDGSARNLNDLPFSAAGKTGTAQFLNNQKTHAWFECFAPYENPKIAVIVLIEGGGGGHEIAAPVAKEIMQYYFANQPNSN